MASSSNDVGASSSHTPAPAPAVVTATGTILLPRVTIQFCTQCKWLLRAAYYAQELLSTFSNSLAEVSLQPSLGGIFRVELITSSPSPSSSPNTITTTTTRLWDRKSDGGFPETKELKRRVRDVIQPGRSLGHVDREYPRAEAGAEGGPGAGVGGEEGKDGKEGKEGEEKKVDGETGGEVCKTDGGAAGGEKCEDCE